MKCWKWLLVALMTASVLLTPWRPAQADEEGWGLLLKSPHVGILYLYVTSEGFALVIKETGAKFVTHAPDWRVVMYNDKTQVYYVERLQDISLSEGKKKKIINHASVQNTRVGRTETIGGMRATQYLLSTYSLEGSNRQAEVWITPDIIPPEQLFKTLEKIFSFDTSQFPKGMPLKIKISDEGGKRDLIYETLNVQKQTIHTASFSYPPTYKRVDSELAVLMDEKSRQKMESILDDTDDLNSILGSTTYPSHPPAGGQQYGGTTSSAPQQPYRPPQNLPYRPPTPMTRPATTYSAPPPAAPKKPAGDWWSNMFNALSGK